MNEKEIIRRVSEKIRLERHRKKLSQQELADLSGFSTKYINLIENQRANPSIVVVVKLCEVLEICLNELLEE